MYCKNCGQNNQSDAKFCEKCGTKINSELDTNVHHIVEETNQQTTTASQVQQQGANQKQYIEKGKEISKLYFSFFLSILKKPVPVAETVNKSQLINGIITIVVFSLMVPLMTYFGLKNAFSHSMFSPDISFSNVVIIPVFSLVILILLIGLIIFGVVKIGRSSYGLLDVIARFGAFLVVPTALLAIATIFSLISSFIFIPFLFLGLLSASFVIPLVIYSLKKEEPKGIDTFYCTIITYIGIIILFMIIGEQAFRGLEEIVDNFSYFNF